MLVAGEGAAVKVGELLEVSEGETTRPQAYLYREDRYDYLRDVACRMRVLVVLLQWTWRVESWR